MKKRIISIALSLVMIAGVIPFINMDTDASASTTSFNDIINMSNQQPAGYQPNDTSNPYNAVKGQPFLMSEQNELFVFRSADINKNAGNNSHIYVGDSLDTVKAFSKLMNIDGDFTDGGVTLSGFAKGNNYKANSNYTLSYMEAVAFDAYGTGRKSHVAYTGYDHTAQRTRVIVVDASGNYVASTNIAESGEFFGTDKSNTVGQHEAANFLSITAGHYSNSYKGEHLVVYAHGKGTSANVVELSLSGSTLTVVNGENNKMMNPKFNVTPPSSDTFSKRLSWRLAADLTTGDFNGDGVDDLAVVSQMHRPKDDKSTNYDANVFMPYVSIAYGGSGNIVKASNAVGSHIYIQKDNSGKIERHSVTGAGIDAGDVDGDGVDEIVLSGVSAWTDVATNGKASTKNAPFPNKNMSRIAVISGKGNAISHSFYSEFDNPKILKDGNGYNTNDNIWQHMKPTCVAVDGQNSAEYVFYMGYMMKLAPGKSDVDIKYTQPYFKNEKDGGVDQVFIQSAAAGNFDANALGREQLAYVIGLKRNDIEDYSHELGFISASKYTLDGSTDGTPENKESGSFGIASAFDSNDPYKNNLTSEKGCKNEQRVNAFVVAIDNDNDGVMASYKGKHFLYTDPQVKAVLQAAPYFGELSEYADLEGNTEYRISTSYTLGSSKGEDTSWSVGIAAEVDTPVCSMAMEAGYVGSLSKEYTQENTVTYGKGFSATEEDMVVIERIPLQIYEYEAEGKNGKTTLTVQVPMNPTYTTLSIDEYNTFVDEYNAYVDKGYNSFNNKNDNTKKAKDKIKLNKITAQYLMDNEGNPWKYMATYDQFVAFDDSTIALGHVPGSSFMSYDKEDAVGQSLTSSHGFSIGLSVLFGVNTPVGGATSGITSSMEQSFSTGKYSNTASTDGTQGTVTHIPNSSIEELSDDILNAYNFSWKYGKWDLALTGDSSIKTPVYGYQVTGITAPAAVVTDLKGKLSEDGTSAELTWSAPDISANSGRTQADGYNVYQVEESGAYKKLDVVVNGNATDGFTATVTGLVMGTDASFVVAGYIGNKVGAYSNVYMTNSIEAAIAAAMDAAEEAKRIAEKAEADANEALAYAKEAAESSAEDREAAELARQQAEVAKEAAENARVAAEIAQSAAEAAQTAAESNNEEAAQAAAEAAQTAVEAAQYAANSAQSAVEAAEAAAKAQRAQEAAETAQKASEKSAEEAKAAAEEAKKAAEEVVKKANTIIKGTNGLTPFIGDNGNWWIGTEDTGVKASIVGNGTEDVDGDGIISAKLNEEGELIITLADGSTFRAVSADDTVKTNAKLSLEDLGSVKTIAIAALGVSTITLLWNVIALAVSLLKKKGTS